MLLNSLVFLPSMKWEDMIWSSVYVCHFSLGEHGQITDTIKGGQISKQMMRENEHK